MTIQALLQRIIKPRQAPAKPGKGEIERRAHERKALSMGVSVVVRGMAPLQARAFDVSDGGIGFVAQSSLRTGSACQLTFTLSSTSAVRREIETRATIAYCFLSPEMGGYKVGAQFKDLGGSANTAVQEFLRGQ